MKARLLASVALVAVVAVASGAQVDPVVAARNAPISPRILYSSDWSGTAQIYAVDPSGKSPTGQITFGRAPACADNAEALCGFRDPTPSPDGRRVFFWDFVSGSYLRRSLFVANADGRGRRRVTVAEGSIVAAVWAPDSRRLAYRDNHGIHVVGADGSGDRLLPATKPGDDSPAWSPDGRSVAFIDPGRNDLVVVTGSERRVAVRAERIWGFAWSPAGRWIAFQSGGVNLVRPDGTGRRRVAAGSAFAWSPDGTQLAVGGDGVRIYDVRSRTTRRVTDAASAILWSPDGRLLAGRTAEGIALVDVRTGRTRRLTRDVGERLSWAPDGRSLAYVVHRGFDYRLGGSEFRTVGLNGEIRTIVAEGDRYGGEIAGMVWMRPPAGVRYRKPLPRTLATVSADELIAPWTIRRLATDGSRVAYVACGHVFVWRPSANAVEQADLTTSLSPWCSDSAFYGPYTVALADDRVAYSSLSGGPNSYSWWLGWTRPGDRFSACELGRGAATGGGIPFRPAFGQIVGEAVGSGVDLFYSSWGEGGTSGAIVTTAQQILRAPADGCPGSSIRLSGGGPLVPLDADAGRVAVAGDNETWVLDRGGAIVTRVSDPLLAAQLSGSDLVVLRRGELRHYDAASGELLHTWPLPDVTTGRECGSPNRSRCDQKPRLLLEDLARGLVTYVLDGRVHVLRLADGADAVVAPGSLARFMDAGLVHADGTRLHLVPFDRLPL